MGFISQLGFAMLILASLTIHARCDDASRLFPTILVPRSLRLNVTTNVLFVVHKPENLTVAVRETSAKRLLLYKDILTFATVGPSLVPIKLRGSAGSGKALFTVIDSVGARKESSVELLDSAGHAFLQTDKPIYTPREPVRIRFVRLDDGLKPIREAVKLRIQNPQKITVEENFYPEQTELRYFGDHVFEFPPAPMLGTWQAILAYGEEFKVKRNVSFEVKEYNLPTFSVELESPRMITPSNSLIEGRVKAFYVYGKPVSGTVTLKYGIKDRAGKTTFIGTSKLKHLRDGIERYQFSSSEFRVFSWFPQIDGSRFVVEATITEEATSKKEKGSSDSALFTSKPYVISFGNSFSDFKPNQETLVVIDVTEASGAQAAGVPLSVAITGDDAMLLQAGKYTTDRNGRVVLRQWSMTGQRTMNIVARTNDTRYSDDEQTTTIFKLKQHDSTSGYLILKNKGADKLSVGQVFQGDASVIDTTARVAHKFIVIVNRGQIYNIHYVGPDGQVLLYIERNKVPSIRLIAIAVINDEIVTDSLNLEVSNEDCGLKLDFEVGSRKVNETRPGTEGHFNIQGASGDYVSLVGVDEAVTLLAEDKTLTKERLMEQLKKTDLGCGVGGGENALDVLANSGLVSVGTSIAKGSGCATKRRVKRNVVDAVAARFDGRAKTCCILGMLDDPKLRSCEMRFLILKKHLPRDEECHDAFGRCCYEVRPKPQTVIGTPEVFQNPADRVRTHGVPDGFVHIAYEEKLERNTLARRDFRETWLFDIILLNSSNYAHRVTLPHSITTWSVSAASLSIDKGFCLLPQPIRITSFLPMFMQVSLPYSVVQYEQVEMTVTLFNYGPSPLKMLVSMFGVEGICSEALPGERSQRKQVTLRANSAESVAFPLVPLEIGEFDVKVLAIGFEAQDQVIKKLYVVSQGVRVEDDYTFQLDPQNQQRRRKRSIETDKFSDVIDEQKGVQKSSVKLVPSRDVDFIVPRTQECIISAIADRYGGTVKTALSDLDHLLRQPKGCGEQTIIFMAPTLFTLKYLSSTNKLTGDQRERGVKYLKAGYKRELDFRKENGAFSTFTSRPPSVWLTAFVLRVFCQALPFIKHTIDPEVLTSGTAWLLHRQDRDGSWTETYPVLHKGIMGGVEGRIPLTAFVLITVRECSNARDLSLSSSEMRNFERVAVSAETYLLSKESAILQKKNAFVMALVGYSLTFSANSAHPTRFTNELKRIANTDDGRNWMFWRNPFQIETTAYALLAIMKSGLRNSLDAQAISNFLNSQRSFSGSFDSTQDTVVALEALSQYAELQSKSSDSEMKLTCNVSADANRFKRSLHFHKDNAQVMQRFKWTPQSDKLEFETHGNGLGLVSVKLAYNVLESPEKLCKFDVAVDVKEYRERRQMDADDDDSIGDEFFNKVATDFPAALVDELGVGPRPGSKHGRLTRTRRSPGAPALKPLRALSPMRRWPFPTRSDRPSGANNRSSSSPSSNGMHLVTSVPLREAMSGSRVTPVSTAGAHEELKELGDPLASPESGSAKSKLVLELSICTRYLARRESDMSIVDVGIPSGYRAEPIEDLEALLSEPESLVSKYEITTRGVIFYLEKIPSGRSYCIKFRIVREIFVANLQSAIVRVYDYYAPDDSCTHLYSPTRFTELLETRCDSQTCRCARESNCPDGRQLLTLGEIAVRQVPQAREKLIQLVCSEKFAFVWTGRVLAEKTHLKGIRMLSFKIDTQLKKDALLKGDSAMSRNEGVWLTLSDECTDLTVDTSDVIVFGAAHEGSERHMNGSAIYHAYGRQVRNDAAHDYVSKLVSWLKQKATREGWSC